MPKTQLKAGKIAWLPALIFTAVLVSCATGGPKPLTIEDLDKIGWDRGAAFQCYLSSQITLTRLRDSSTPADVYFDNEGAAHVREIRGSVVLASSLEGRIARYNRRDQYLYIAFEEGDGVLPFARDKDGRFSLMVTVDPDFLDGAEFVEYEEARYKVSARPHLNVVINEANADFRRQMGGSQVRAASNTEAVIGRVSDKLVADLPRDSKIAVLNISSGSNETSSSIVAQLEYRLKESKKFRIVERASLDAVRSEQQFQISGEVNDASAVTMGRMSEANIVITGTITGTGSDRYLTVKALDVESAEILSIARESF